MHCLVSLVAALPVLTALVAAQNTTYDYVVVGAGTAGMLLAVVLSENPDISVLVLEGGGDGRTDYNITNPERRGKCMNSYS